ncbi:MAG: UDP-glucose 4-epimerase GalE [Desulfuromonadales bacterium]|nr:UDP-glucose 4-epimerase GalE [Desulfuromonadales bacterium]
MSLNDATEGRDRLAVLRQKRILVTGGAGYIGSHVVLALGEAGCDVLTLDNLSTGHRHAVLCGEFLPIDLADTDRLHQAIRQFRPDAVLHFAAAIEVNESMAKPLTYYRNNTANALNLLEAVRAAAVDLFVFSSTAAVYGNPVAIPVNEEAALAPINPYGASKMMTERLLADLVAAEPDFRYVALRYFNVAGADPAGRLGQDYANPTHLITRALKTSLGQYAQLQIFGDDYPTADGTCVRDYIHVTDLARAHLDGLVWLFGNGPSRVYNCGYGHGFSVREVVEMARRITGSDFPVEIAGRRAGDPAELVADSRRIRDELGWQPRHADLETLIATAWAWEQSLAGRRSQ